MRDQVNFERGRLPDPLIYFEHQGLRLLGRGAWRSALCPFHQDCHPSLRVNAQSGAFRCMACGAKGGDVLAFHRARHGLSFVQAAHDLGAMKLARQPSKPQGGCRVLPFAANSHPKPYTYIPEWMTRLFTGAFVRALRTVQNGFALCT